MNYEPRQFSYTGETVFPLGLGTHGHGHAFGGIPHEQSSAVFEKLSRKLTPESKILIDTAPRYGHGRVERWLGEYFSPDDQRILIATKGGRPLHNLSAKAPRSATLRAARSRGDPVP